MALDLSDLTDAPDTAPAYAPSARIAALELDDAPPAPAPIPAPQITVHTAEANGSTFADNAREGDGLTARASGQVRTSADILASADLDWDPIKVPLLAEIDGRARTVARKHVIVRSDTRDPVAVVGDRYVPIAHRPLFALADAIVADSGGALRVCNAGHKGSGAKPFLQLAMEDRSPAGDVRRMLSIFTSHDGTLCATMGLSTVMIVCRNTYSHALGQAKQGLRIRHTASAEEMIRQIDEIARLASAHAVEWDNAALRMLGTPFTDAHMHALASALIPGDSTRATNSRNDLMSAWQSSPGARPGTAWGAAQAVTHYASHTIGSADARAESAIFGTGTAADFQSSAFAYLDSADAGIERLQSVQLYRLA